MNWADWLILVIVGISCLVGVLRGFIKEALSLLVWVTAFVVAMLFHRSMAILFNGLVDSVSVQHVLAFVSLFLLTLIVGAMVNYLLGKLVRATGLTGTDRVLGLIFGLLRGAAVVISLLILLPHMVPIDQETWWRQSQLIPHFAAMEGRALGVWDFIYSKAMMLFK